MLRRSRASATVQAVAGKWCSSGRRQHSCSALLLRCARVRRVKEERERREMREKSESLTLIFLKIFNGSSKILNTKVVENSKSYNFHFRHKLI